VQKSELINKLKQFNEFKGPPGPQGPTGSQGPIGLGYDSDASKKFLKDNSLWCADGDLCKLPAGKFGISWSGDRNRIFTDATGVNIRVNNKTMVSVSENGTRLYNTDNTQSAALIVGGNGILMRNGDENDDAYTGGRGAMTLSNNMGNLRLKASTNAIILPENNYLQFGQGFVKENNAGQISYGKHDGGENGSLNIVGGGKNGNTRVVKIYDNLIVNGRDILAELDALKKKN
jgi:hypothetical protein